MNIILSFSSIKHFQEAEGVKDSVITAQVGRILHKAFSLVDFISFVVDMWDELFHALSIGANYFIPKKFRKHFPCYYRNGPTIL